MAVADSAAAGVAVAEVLLAPARHRAVEPGPGAVQARHPQDNRPEQAVAVVEVDVVRAEPVAAAVAVRVE